MSDRETRLARMLARHEESKRRRDASPGSPAPRPSLDSGGTGPEIALEQIPPTPEPELGDVLTLGRVPPRPLDRAFVAHLLYDSLAVSAWRRTENSLAELRVAPSATGLNAVLASVALPAIDGLSGAPAVFRYHPRTHALAAHRALAAPFDALAQGPALLVGLGLDRHRARERFGSSWYREAHLDLGHAIAAVTIAASALGYRANLLDAVPATALDALFGFQRARGESGEVALFLAPDTQDRERCSWEDALRALAPTSAGDDDDFRDIDEDLAPRTSEPFAVPHARPPEDHDPLWFLVSARETIRARRSARRFDARTAPPRQILYHILRTAVPAANRVPFTALPWPPAIHAAVFVHRSFGLEPGLYVASRTAEDENDLKQALRSPALAFVPALDQPPGVRLLRIAAGDHKAIARAAFGDQALAADGAITIALLARFHEPLERFGASFYRAQLQEAGAVGHALLLASAAAGLGGVTLGLFDDRALHTAIGIEDDRYQALYGFAAGLPVPDREAEFLPAYPDPTRPL